jgi:hypothetical protein
MLEKKLFLILSYLSVIYLGFRAELKPTSLLIGRPRRTQSNPTDLVGWVCLGFTQPNGHPKYKRIKKFKDFH